MRYQHTYAFGRFRETPESIIEANVNTTLDGSSAMTVVWIGEMIRPATAALEAPVDHSFFNNEAPGSGSGWGFIVTEAGWGAFVGDGALRFNSHTAVPRVPQRFIWSLSVTGGTFRSRFMNDELASAVVAIVANNTNLMTIGAAGANPAAQTTNYAPSFRVAAVLASMSVGLVDLATLHAELEDNLAQDRALDTGLTFAPEFYLDARDGLTGVVDRIGGEAFTVTGGVELASIAGELGAA